MKKRNMENQIKDGLSLYVEHIGTEHNVFKADREYIFIAYIAYGSGYAIIDRRKMDINSGDVFIVNPKTKVEFIADIENNSIEQYLIMFRKEYLRGEWDSYAEEFAGLKSFFENSDAGYIKVKDSENKEIRNYFVRLINEYYTENPARDSALFGQLMSVIPIILRRHNLKTQQIFSKNTLVDETIRQIRNTIYQNPKPSELAAHRFVTTTHLGRVFKQETGMTVTQYINNLRVEMTKDILANTDRPIEHIPAIFNIKLKYLQQIFKKHTGMSMREYRSKHHYRQCCF